MTCSEAIIFEQMVAAQAGSVMTARIIAARRSFKLNFMQPQCADDRTNFAEPAWYRQRPQSGVRSRHACGDLGDAVYESPNIFISACLLVHIAQKATY